MIRDDIIAQAQARQRLTYRLDPVPDGVTTTDCSLLVRDSVRAAGAGELPRTAEQQRQACVPTSAADVLLGDLWFFEGTYDAAGPAGPDGRIASHVGIALGNGRMLDAHERTNGMPDVGVTDITTDYWRPKTIGVYRLPSLAGTATAAPITPTEGTVTIESMPRGIDVAVYQGNPDWSAVAGSGLAFAFTKASQGTGYVNPTFARNWAELRATGMARGAYHFAEPDEHTPEAEAAFFVNTIMSNGGLQAGDLLALDLEDYEGSLTRANDVGGWALGFLRAVEKLVGFAPLLYTAPNVIAEHSLGGYPALADYGLWLASYRETMPAAPAPWPVIAFWQHSDDGSVPGIAGAVDLNSFNGSADRIRLYGAPWGGTAPAPPAPAPAPSAAPDLGTLVGVAYHEDGVIIPALVNARQSGDWSQVDAAVKFLRENNPDRAA